MTKLTHAIACIVLVLATAFCAPAQGCGDMNRDGVIGVTDMIQMVTIILEGKGGQVLGREMADVNLDDKINIADILITVSWFLDNEEGVPEACIGCADDNACNRGALETRSREGQCIYPPTFYRCDTSPEHPIDGCEADPATGAAVCYSCELDEDFDGVCDPLEVDGCMDPTACNHGVFVEIPDQMCTHTSEFGTTFFFDAAALVHPGFTVSGDSYIVDSKENCRDLCDDAELCVASTYLVTNALKHCFLFEQCDHTHNTAAAAGLSSHAATELVTFVKPTHKATDEDGSCVYPTQFYRCDVNTTTKCVNTHGAATSAPFAEVAGGAREIHYGERVCFACITDADNDKVCDEIENAGCMDDTKCNYKASYTQDDGSCMDTPHGRHCDPDHNDAVSSCIKDDHGDAVCFSCDADGDDDFVCDGDEHQGCMDVAACNHDVFTTYENKACLWGDHFVDAELHHPSFVVNDGYRSITKDECMRMCALTEITEADDSTTTCKGSTWLNGSPNRCLLFKTCTPVAWEDANIPLAHDGLVSSLTSFVAPSTTWATNDDGSCLVPPQYYQCDSTVNHAEESPNQQGYTRCDADDNGVDHSCYSCINDADGDLVCDENEVTGCMTSTACNFDELATDDDGSCLVTPTNYKCDDAGDVCFVDAHGDNTCYSCILDDDDDKVCNQVEVGGCTDSTKCNYHPLATDDDGSCLDDPTNYECDRRDGDNCITDDHDDSICYRCINDVDHDKVCDEVEGDGCMDSTACNYDADATDEDNSCIYAPEHYKCDQNTPDRAGSCVTDKHGDMVCFSCVSDADGDHICNEEEVKGCTDETACNHGLFPTYSNMGCAAGEGTVEYTREQYPDNPNFPVDGDGDFVHADQAECLRLCTTSRDCAAATLDAAHHCKLYQSCDIEILSEDTGTLLMVRPTTVLLATQDDGSCLYAKPHHHCPHDVCGGDAGVFHCPTACRIDKDEFLNTCDEDATCLSDADGDGVCDGLEVFGCTDTIACNYNHFEPIKPTQDDGSCLYPSEVYLDCREFCITDEDRDRVCDEIEVDGCTDPTACNFHADATDNDGSCLETPLNYRCALANETDDAICEVDAHGDTICFRCVNDEDLDLVCDEFEIYGCESEPSACNFWENATEDDGSCLVTPQYYECDVNGDVCKTDARTGEEFCYSCIDDDDNDDVCAEHEVVDCMDSAACNFNPLATDDDTCIYAPTYYVCDNNSIPDLWYVCANDKDWDLTCDENEIVGCMRQGDIFYNDSATENDDAMCKGADSGGDCIEDYVEDCSGDGDCCNKNWIGDGYPDCRDQFHGCDLTCHDEDGGDCAHWGCTNSTACNFDYLATRDDGSCLYAVDYYHCPVYAGKTNIEACELDYNQDQRCDEHAECIADDDGDGVCNELEIEGCMRRWNDDEVVSCNFNESATDDVGCIFKEQYKHCDGTCMVDYDGDEICDEVETGCMEPLACNFNHLATQSEGECDMPVDLYDCFGKCLVDADNDTVCDDLEVYGCTDMAACNYMPSATEHQQADCSYLPADADREWIDCNYECLHDEDGDTVCDEEEIVGCQDPIGCNYNENATDGLNEEYCRYRRKHADYPDIDVYRCDGGCERDADGDRVCDEDEIDGCGDKEACTYDPTHTDANASKCIYAGLNRDCDQICLPDYLPDCSDPSICCPKSYLGDGYKDYSSEEGRCDMLCYDMDGGDARGCKLHAGACNYDEHVLEHVESSCVFPPAHRDCDGNCVKDSDVDYVCDEEEVPGCNHPDACNYDPMATDLVISQCILPVSPEYRCHDIIPLAKVTWLEDGVLAFCQSDEVRLATDLPFSGTDVENRTPPACLQCIHDTNENFVCDELEIYGCTDPEACNYYANATWDYHAVKDSVTGEWVTHQSCIYPPEPKYACDREQTEASRVCAYDQWSHEKFCYGCDGDADQDGVCAEDEVVGCGDSACANYSPETTEHDPARCLYDPTGYRYDPENGYKCLFDIVGGRYCYSCIDDEDLDGYCDADDTKLFCTDRAACNAEVFIPFLEDPDVTGTDDTLCIYPNEVYLDCHDECINDSDEDGICDEIEVVGCRSETACNYAASATDHSENMCDYSCLGCTDASACNYDELRTVDDGSCWHPTTAQHDCDGKCKEGLIRNCGDADICCLQSWLLDHICDDGTVENRPCDLTCYEGNGELQPCNVWHDRNR